MGKILYFLCFILSVFPTDANENRRHIHVTRRGSKKAHIGDTVAKIWIEKNGERCIEIAWSELSSDEEADIISVIEKPFEISKTKGRTNGRSFSWTEYVTTTTSGSSETE